MPFNKGDFLLIEFTVRVKETGVVIDTTDAELARRRMYMIPISSTDQFY